MAYFDTEGTGLPAGFDPETYMQLNPDVREAYSGDPNQAWQHYLNWGRAEGRNYGATTATADTTAPSVGGLPAGFDPAKYLELNPDLIAAYGNDTTQATQHYLNWGAAENRNYGQAGWGGITDPHTYWANSGLPAAEIDRRISLGYARPETWEGYGPGSPFWSQLGGVNPTDPEWNDYYKRAENWSSTGSPEAQARANDDDGFMGLGDIGTLAMLAAAIYSGGAALGAWGAGAGSAATGAGLAEGFGGAGILGDSAMWGLGELGAGLDAASLAAGDSMAGLIPAGELGAWMGAGAAGTSGGSLADLMSGLGDTTADIAAGNAAGSGALAGLPSMGLDDLAVSSISESGATDWNALTDGFGFGNYGDSLADPNFIDTLGEWAGGSSGGQLLPYGQSMATAEELAAMQAKYPDWYNALTGVTDGGSSFGRIGNTLSSLLGGTSALKSLFGGAAGGGAGGRVGGGVGGVGGAGGYIPIPVGQGKSILEIMMSEPQDNGLDEFLRLMAQSGKGE